MYTTRSVEKMNNEEHKFLNVVAANISIPTLLFLVLNCYKNHFTTIGPQSFVSESNTSYYVVNKLYHFKDLYMIHTFSFLNNNDSIKIATSNK